MSLNIENLRVSLQKKKILHGIDLEIQEGELYLSWENPAAERPLC